MTNQHHTPRRDPAVSVGAVHHIELWVPDLTRAMDSWLWLLGELGYQPFQEFTGGVSWRHPASGAYLVLEQSPDMLPGAHDRHRPGLNHLAFHGGSRANVERLTAASAGHGWTLRERIGPPADEAGDPDQRSYYAVYLTDGDGFEVELVAHEGAGKDHA